MKNLKVFLSDNEIKTLLEHTSNYNAKVKSINNYSKRARIISSVTKIEFKVCLRALPIIMDYYKKNAPKGTKRIPGYYEYANEKGEIFNFNRYKKKFYKDERTGYYKVSLTKVTGGDKLEYVQIAIADTFIDNPKKLSDVNHIDRDKSNNSVSNLERLSHSDNIKHMYRTAKK